jgi:hypothetical protein
MAEHIWLNGMVCFVDQSEIKSTMIAAVGAKWDAIRGERDFPSRREIDPFEFKEWLPYLSLVDLHDEPFRVYYRLIGTEVARFAEEDFGNKWLHETDWGPAVIEVNHALYRRLWEDRAPTYGLSLVDWDKRQKYVFEWALFPLSDDGETISGCLSVDDFTPIAGRTYLLR